MRSARCGALPVDRHERCDERGHPEGGEHDEDPSEELRGHDTPVPRAGADSFTTGRRSPQAQVSWQANRPRLRVVVPAGQRFSSVAPSRRT